jgi:hypothetical protein
VTEGRRRRKAGLVSSSRRSRCGHRKRLYIGPPPHLALQIAEPLFFWLPIKIVCEDVRVYVCQVGYLRGSAALLQKSQEQKGMLSFTNNTIIHKQPYVLKTVIHTKRGCILMTKYAYIYILT